MTQTICIYCKNWNKTTRYCNGFKERINKKMDMARDDCSEFQDIRTRLV